MRPPCCERNRAHRDSDVWTEVQAHVSAALVTGRKVGTCGGRAMRLVALVGKTLIL